MEPAASNKKGKLLIPAGEVNRVMTEVAVQPGPTGLLKLAGIKNIVEGWCASACSPHHGMLCAGLSGTLSKPAAGDICPATAVPITLPMTLLPAWPSSCLEEGCVLLFSEGWSPVCLTSYQVTLVKHALGTQSDGCWRTRGGGGCARRYQKRGFVFGYISHYEGMETGDIVARVVEGRVNRVNVVQVDDEGGPRKGPGEVSPDIILRELPFKVRGGAARRAPTGCAAVSRAGCAAGCGMGRCACVKLGTAWRACARRSFARMPVLQANSHLFVRQGCTAWHCPQYSQSSVTSGSRTCCHER